MGFCLFEHPDEDGAFFAVNPAHVTGMGTFDHVSGYPCTFLSYDVPLPGFKPIALGSETMVKSMIMRALKIGVGKAHIKVVGNHLNVEPTSMLINNPDRIALVRELPPEKAFGLGLGFTTASQIFFADGTQRIIAHRPGTFAFHVNANHNVPILMAG